MGKRRSPIWWWFMALPTTNSWGDLSKPKTMEYFAGYLLEKSLAIDNVFVWLMIFAAFAIPAALQRKILLYGVLGAIVLRTLFILLVHGSFKSFLGYFISSVRSWYIQALSS